jgi:hypothetical protein
VADRFGATDPEEEMSPRSLLLALLVSSFAATVAHAQQSPVTLRPGPARLLWERPSPALSAESAREPLGGLLGPDDMDQRYPGFFVGAGLGLLLTAWAFAWCSDDDNCDSGRVLPMGVLATGVLGLSGAVIGGFLPK